MDCKRKLSKHIGAPGKKHGSCEWWELWPTYSILEKNRQEPTRENSIGQI